MCKVSSSAQFVKRSLVAASREVSAKGHWVPNTDVYATDEGLVIKVELAGMRSDDLEITVEGNRLRICGQRPDGCRTAKCSFLVMAINYGPFETPIELPAGYDISQAKAAYLNGFLRIDVPVMARPESKKVMVSSAEAK